MQRYDAHGEFRDGTQLISTQTTSDRLFYNHHEASRLAIRARLRTTNAPSSLYSPLTTYDIRDVFPKHKTSGQA